MSKIGLKKGFEIKSDMTLSECLNGLELTDKKSKVNEKNFFKVIFDKILANPDRSADSQSSDSIFSNVTDYEDYESLKELSNNFQSGVKKLFDKKNKDQIIDDKFIAKFGKLFRDVHDKIKNNPSMSKFITAIAEENNLTSQKVLEMIINEFVNHSYLKLIEKKYIIRNEYDALVFITNKGRFNKDLTKANLESVLIDNCYKSGNNKEIFREDHFILRFFRSLNELINKKDKVTSIELFMSYSKCIKNSAYNDFFGLEFKEVFYKVVTDRINDLRENHRCKYLEHKKVIDEFLDKISRDYIINNDRALDINFEYGNSVPHPTIDVFEEYVPVFRFDNNLNLEYEATKYDEVNELMQIYNNVVDGIYDVDVIKRVEAIIKNMDDARKDESIRGQRGLEYLYKIFQLFEDKYTKLLKSQNIISEKNSDSSLSGPNDVELRRFT